VVGLVGGGLVAVLVATAVVLVSAKDPAPPFQWKQDLVLSSDSVDDLAGMPSDAVLQQLLTVRLDGVPEGVQVGETIVFTVTLRNDSDQEIPLDPCPTYRVAFLDGGSRSGEAERPVLADLLGRFDCDDEVVLHEGDQVSTPIAFTVDPAGFTQLRTTGAIAIELWPAAEEMSPRAEVPGVVAFSPRGFEGFVPPPGIGGDLNVRTDEG
jgi:hypothetical protein